MDAAERSIEHGANLRFIGDGFDAGTNFYWSERLNCFLVIDLQNKTVSTHDGLALARLADGADPDEGLNQESLGCDLEAGLWLVPDDFLDDCDDGYITEFTIVPKN